MAELHKKVIVILRLFGWGTAVQGGWGSRAMVIFRSRSGVTGVGILGDYHLFQARAFARSRSPIVNSGLVIW